VPVDYNWYVAGDGVTVLGQGSLVRNGYSFLGWSTRSTATVAMFTAGSYFTIYDDVELFAVWSQNIYTVTYEPGIHGTFAVQVTGGLHYGDSTPNAPVVIGDAGWNFTGWFPALSTTVTSDATYTAQWTQTPPTTPTPTPSPPSTTATPTSPPTTGPATTPPPPTTITPTPTSPPAATPTTTENTNQPPTTNTSNWSAVNLFISILGAVIAILTATFTLLNNKSRQSRQKLGQHGYLLLIIVMVLATTGFVVFLLTQNLNLPMGWIINKWTNLHAAIIFIETITAWLYIKINETKTLPTHTPTQKSSNKK
jgi:uncharacterized repeat protein (TIGR02543 family)